MATRPVTKADWGLRSRMFVVMALLAALYLAFLTFISQWVSLGGVVFIAAIMLGAQYFFSHKLAMFGMGAKEVTPEEAPELHAMVERLAASAGIPKPKVAISKMPVPNAFATGRNPSHAVVAVTEVLMERLEPNEVEAVLGHEITHVINRDVAVMTLASFFGMVAMLLMRSFLFAGIFGGGGGDDDDDSGGSIWMVYLVSMAVYFISQILLLALGRYRELAADRGGAHLTRPGDLASALQKIASDVSHTPQQVKRAVEPMSAFFIVPTSIKEIFSSHPSLERRLEQLAEIEREMGAAG